MRQLINVEGTYNFRHLGGFRANAGTTRSDVLFRSDALHQLTDAGRNHIRGLGISRVLDLRDSYEREQHPNAVFKEAVVVPHSVFPDARVHIRTNLSINELTELIYLQHGDTLTSAVALIAKSLTQPGGSNPASATVFHCTAGKDRTGAVAALTLLSVGVDRDEVIEDYARSAEYLQGEWADHHLSRLRNRGIEITPRLEELICGTPTRAVEQALKRVEREYGSVYDYLLTHGLGEANLEHLHRAFIA